MDRSEDGNIFIDRDGKHFGQVLEYLRDGVVSVAEKDASQLDIGELRWLKREFDFYCIELYTDPHDVAFVAGGEAIGDNISASMELYDGTSGAWREVTPIATVRSEFGLCKLSDGDIYVNGGSGVDNGSLASVERYDPGLDIWSTVPALPWSRYGHCVCVSGDAMYVLGGTEEDEEGCVDTASSMLKFDSQQQAWIEVALLPEDCEYAGACVAGRDIYTFGGNICGGITEDRYRSATYSFNTDTNEWSTRAPLRATKRGFSACVFDGLIYVLGEWRGMRQNYVSTFDRFDPGLNVWTNLKPASLTRVQSIIFVLDGNIYAVGGCDGGEWQTSIERYSVTEDTWSPVVGGEMGQPKRFFGALVVRLEEGLFDSLITKAKSWGCL
jgi:hypothetical protein